MSSFKIVMTGDRQLDRTLKAIADDIGSKSINAEARKATRDAMKTIVLPDVKADIPVETGFLESEIVVKSIKRSRSKLGTAVGFRDDLFRGDTFYGGFHEFGFKLRGGGFVPGDSYLRRNLYRNETRVFQQVRGRMRQWVASRRPV